jgi:hypothetical protein
MARAEEPPSFAPKIEVHDEDGLAYWAERLRVSREEIVEAVAEVGDNPRAVATELGVALLD